MCYLNQLQDRHGRENRFLGFIHLSDHQRCSILVYLASLFLRPYWSCYNRTLKSIRIYTLRVNLKFCIPSLVLHVAINIFIWLLYWGCSFIYDAVILQDYLDAKSNYLKSMHILILFIQRGYASWILLRIILICYQRISELFLRSVPSSFLVFPIQFSLLLLITKIINLSMTFNITVPLTAF